MEVRDLPHTKKQFIGLRGAIIKKNGKIWEKFPNRLDPPSPSEISDFFEFQTFLKIADPVLGFPKYGSSCLGRRDDLQELVSFSSSVQ